MVQGKYALEMPMARFLYVEIDKSKGQLAGSLSVLNFLSESV
jgi:hypothetical protein